MASDFTKVAAQTASDMMRQAVSQATTAAQTAAQAAAAITPTAAPKKRQPKSSGPSHRQDGGCTSPSTGCIRGQNRYKTRCKIHRHQGPQHQKPA